MNRIMKSAMAIAAVTAMSLGALAGCGGSGASDSGKGKVYFLNFKPEAADQWKDLASAYTKETGVQMTVETAASGTYEQQLKSEMAKSEAPRCSRSMGRSAMRTGRSTRPISRTPRSTSSCRIRTWRSKMATRSSACPTRWRPTA